MSGTKKILLFIPMYNCEKQIVRVLTKCDERVQHFISEVIVVNNRSTDNSEQSVKKFIEESKVSIPVKLLRNRENYSLGGSHKVAFEYAIKNNFDYVIVLHGDDQGDIHDILPYLESKEAMKYKSFLGARFEKQSILTNYSKFRIIGNYIFNFFLTAMLGRHISDLGSGLNMYDVNYLKDGFYRYFPNNLTFNVYMLLYGIYAKSEFAFFPLSWREEDQVSNAKFFKQSWEIFTLVIKYKINPARTFIREENAFSKVNYLSDEVN